MLSVRPIARALSFVVLLALTGGAGLALSEGTAAPRDARPNILLAIADDWGWPHAGAYGDPAGRTPPFERPPREGGSAGGLRGRGGAPGPPGPGGRTETPAGPEYSSLEAFLDARPRDRPFCY